MPRVEISSSRTKSAIRLLLKRPIAFHPVLAKLAGSVSAGLMLSQGIYWTEVVSNDPRRGGWFYKTQDEWTQETTLTRWEQETARRSLRKTDFWFEKRRGTPARMYYRIDLLCLERAISQIEETPHSSLRPIVDQVGGEGTNLSAENPRTIAESTQESTSENCGRFAANSYLPVQPKKTINRYIRIKMFADKAAQLLQQEHDLGDGDIAEKLKCWAAQNDLEYFDALAGSNPPIIQAVINARAMLALRQTRKEK